MSFQAVEFNFKIFDMTFFAFAEGSLTVEVSGFDGTEARERDWAYAALFCAFRRLWAGVRLSLSSSLLLPCAWS